MSGYVWPLVSLAVMALLAVFFFLFEKRHVIVEKTVLIAVLSAVSTAGRTLFAAVPSVQPSSFIIIITGMALGAETGFMTGALTALLSSLMLGIGPWTPWQMLAWGLMGFFAGIFTKPLSRIKMARILYGAVWGYLFGWIMNLWMLMTVESIETGLAYIISVYAASFVFDSLHAAANVLLILFGGDAFLKVLSRMAVKYGIATPKKPNKV